jgi:hypothetical protein
MGTASRVGHRLGEARLLAVSLIEETDDEYVVVGAR